MVLNRQKVLSRRRKLNVIQVWLFGIISAACAVSKHGLVIALTNANAPYDLFAILGNNWFTRRLGFNLSSPPSASAEQTRRQIILCSLSASAGKSLFGAVGCKL